MKQKAHPPADRLRDGLCWERPPSIIELRNNALQGWGRCLFIWKETL